MATMLEHDFDQALVDTTGCEAERWMAHHATAFAALSRGTTVVIDIASGDYVSANGWREAQDLFDQRFGPGVPGFTFTVGEPTFVGGGSWRA